MNGPPSGYVTPSTVTWFSCMHSNSFERWSKTFTPVTSDGSRSGVNWIRENEQSIERASAFASIVFPTPGKSSMIRWPSLTRERTQRRSVSAGARTTLPRFSATRRMTSEAWRTSVRCSATDEPFDLVDDRGGDRRLRRLADAALAVVADEDDLVVQRVEADVLAAHVVVDDEIDLFVGQHAPLPLETFLAQLGAESDEHLAVAPSADQPCEHVCSRLELDRPRLAVLRPLMLERLGRSVVGDRGRHQHDIRLGCARADLALDVLCGRRLDNLDPA